MSAAQHTPGPWAVIPKKTPQGDIATVYNTPDGWVSIHAPTWLNIGDQHVAMAHARLIAAAPELLGALQNMLAQYKTVHGTGDMEMQSAIDFAHKAIAKARGVARAMVAMTEGHTSSSTNPSRSKEG